MIESGPWLIILPAIGVAGGLYAFARGILAYRTAAAVSGIAGSSTRSLAAGEVRITGIAEPGPTTLVSPLQSAPCVHYRSRIVRRRGNDTDTVIEDDRSVSFRLRDREGTVIVFPRGAKWELTPRFDETSGAFDDPPPGLLRNLGPATTLTEADREAQIAALLTVRQPSSDPDGLGGDGSGGVGFGLSDFVSVGAPAERMEYREERVEPGDTITIIGNAIPYAGMEDLAADPSGDASSPLDDPEIAADLAEALANGTLRSSPEEAWGNAAIPGFGIGRPDPTPDLAPDDPLGYDLGPEDLVIAAVAGRPFSIHEGTPAQAAGRHESRFWIGLGGAVLAVASAAILLLQLGGTP